MTFNRDERFFYDGIAKRKKFDSEEFELVAAFVAARDGGKSFLGSASAEHLQTAEQKKMAAGMYATTLAQAIKAEEALKWAAQDIKDGKITMDTLVDFGDIWQHEEPPVLYRPKMFR